MRGRDAALSPLADYKRGAALSLVHMDFASTAEKSPAGRFFWIVRNGSFRGGFSLTKAPHKLGKLNFVQFYVVQDKSKIQQNV